ncbi:MAG: histidinol-phosphatase HisJ family protein [Erysipelotrichaceae bacterium]
MLADYHVHTSFSPDSDYPMRQVIEDAIKLKLDEICITDHIDFGLLKSWPENATVEEKEKLDRSLYMTDHIRSSQALKAYQKEYQDQITVKFGYEFGMQMPWLKQFEEVYSLYDLDFVILSVHAIDNHGIWTDEFQLNRSQKEYNDRYYQEIYDLVNNYHDYCVLGHLDSIVRYDRKGIYPFDNNRQLITEILKKAISEGKGIEINTSNVRYGLKDSTPSKEILLLYKSLGGNIITLGSDSHRQGQLASHFQATKQYLLDLGFEYFCTYQKMKPIFHSLEK